MNQEDMWQQYLKACQFRHG